MKKITPTKTKQFITKLGKIELETRLEKLKQEHAKLIGEMHELTSQNGVGIGLGDSLHILQRGRAAGLGARISFIEHLISTAEVVGPPISNEKVQIGSRVTVEIGGEQRTYMIVSSIEADPGRGRISYESPLGKCLLDKRAQDHFEVTGLAKKAIVAKVIAIA